MRRVSPVPNNISFPDDLHEWRSDVKTDSRGDFLWRDSWSRVHWTCSKCGHMAWTTVNARLRPEDVTDDHLPSRSIDFTSPCPSVRMIDVRKVMES